MNGKEELRGILAKIQANNKALNGCTLHSFDTSVSKSPRERWGCSNCGGEVEGHIKKYYELGLKHGSVSSK